MPHGRMAQIDLQHQFLNIEPNLGGMAAVLGGHVLEG